MSGAGLVVLVAVIMAVGLAGTVVPVVPGLALVWGGALLYGLIDDFGTVGGVAFAFITATALAGTAAGVILPRRAAGTAGAGRSSMLLGLAMAGVGFFVVPVIGMPIGGALGIYLGERVRTGDAAVAWRATTATLKGFGWAALAQLGAGVVMVGLWVAWVAFD